MFDRFFPDRYVASTYVIDFEKLYEEGYRGLIFDIDNTLVPPGAPADARASALQAMEIMGTDETNSVFIGDQLFTDVWGAKRTGISNILVKPIHPKEEIQIVLKRYLEKIVLYFYARSKKQAKKQLKKGTIYYKMVKVKTYKVPFGCD